ncbi:MAG: Rv3654c family TadE-like protein [Actinomycetota bacterium]
MTRHGDRGSASLWVLACSTLVILVAMVEIVRTQALLARHRVEASADLSALAAAGRIGIADDICLAAARVAAANGTMLASCRAELADDGRSGTVEVRVTTSFYLVGWGRAVVTASARAGRDPPVARAGRGP